MLLGVGIGKFDSHHLVYPLEVQKAIQKLQFSVLTVTVTAARFILRHTSLVGCVFHSYLLTSWNIEAFSLCVFLTSTKLSEWSPMERRAPAQSSSRDRCT